ncbi:MAG TPA: glycosyltransferase family 2 protein [Methylomirabilota bacterium]|jgi:GT2 family glycosyltransferase|nr:glycosyltransferase family 2 protein [Methylomirabilota bacterium]
MRPEQVTAPTRPTMSAIIPTKNRPGLLANVVSCLLAQTVPVDELIVVDQSDSDHGRALVEELLASAPPERRPPLTYLRDRAIDGAAAARNVGLDLATMDIVICIDDDMVPEPDVLERLHEHYRGHPEVAAITPVITNYTPPPFPERLFGAIFCRGPFRDDRQRVYWNWRRYRGTRLAPVGMLGGGMLSARREALGGIHFDRRYRGASVGEDIDLSWALRARGARLAIATDARVVHNRAPRPATRYEETLLTSWGFVFDKHQPKTLGNRLAFRWFVIGVMLGAVYASLRSGTLAPLRSLRVGLRRLRRNYAGSSFLASR